MTSVKILVCGSVEGKLKQLFKRVSTACQKNGPFSMLLCVGDFFGENEEEWIMYKEGKVKVPLTTYILGPIKEHLKVHYPDIRGCELAENLIYLGPYGIYPCSNGIKVAYLSGVESVNKSVSSFSFEDIKTLETTAGSKPKVDILLTSEWPKGVCTYAKEPDGVDTSNIGSLLVSRLVSILKPRYHFVGKEGFYYERLPYRNHEILIEGAHHVTRFIALAKVGNPLKQKWLYAFNTTPISSTDPLELVSQPSDVTENPFPKDIIAQTNRLYKKEGGNASQFFYDMDAKEDANQNGKHKKRKNFETDSDGQKKKPQHKPSGPCWFCLASPDVEKHMVVSVGSFSYLALAKGGLVSEHLLILPIEHFQSTSDLENECRAEIEKFKSSLKKMFKKKDKTLVFFERNYKTQHLQIQVVPLPNTFTPHLKETFMDVSESCGINLDEVPKHSDIAQMAPPGTPFFYAELPTGEKLFHRIKKNFPIQFGRELLACPPLLNMPERVDWRECKLSQEEEANLRDSIRKMFEPFDFTLEDENSE